MERNSLYGSVKKMVDYYKNVVPMYADCSSEGSGDIDCDCDAVDGS